MTDGVTCKIVGLDVLLAEMRALPQVLQARLLKGATATACSVIRQEAIRLAPESTEPVEEGHPPPGTLKKAIYQARNVNKCTRTREVWVISVRSGRGMRNSGRKTSRFGPTQGTNLDAYYAAWVEFGHYARGPKGQSRASARKAQKAADVRWVSARPFMRPAFETKKAEAQRAFWQYLQEHIPDAVRGMQIIKLKR